MSGGAGPDVPDGREGHPFLSTGWVEMVRSEALSMFGEEAFAGGDIVNQVIAAEPATAPQELALVLGRDGGVLPQRGLDAAGRLVFHWDRPVALQMFFGHLDVGLEAYLAGRISFEGDVRLATALEALNAGAPHREFLRRVAERTSDGVVPAQGGAGLELLSRAEADGQVAGHAVRWPAVTAAVAEMASRTRPGVQVSVRHRGVSVLDLAAGRASPGRPLQTSDLLMLYSCSKVVAIIAVAQLVARGLLRWSTPVAQVVPEFGRNGKDRVTIVELLAHTSQVRGEPLAPLLMSARDQQLEATYAMAGPGRPGSRRAPAVYAYFWSWAVLAEVVRLVSGTPYGRYVRDHVMGPIGRTDTWVGMTADEHAAHADRIATMYDHDGTSFAPTIFSRTPDGPTHEIAAAGAWGTAADLCALLSTFHPTRIEKLGVDETSYLALTGCRATSDKGRRFGLGLQLEADRDDKHVFGRHTSGATFGMYGGTSAFACTDPETDLTLVFTTTGVVHPDIHFDETLALNDAVVRDLGLVQNS